MKKIDLSILIDHLIEKSGLSAADLRQVKSYISKTVPKILIQPKIKVDWANRSASYFGGLPSLPSEEFWPVDDKGSAGIFLGQVNCSDVYSAAPELLPEKGMLFFFSWAGISEGDRDLSKYSTVLYLDIPPETPPLKTLPASYRGGDLLSDTWFYSSHASLRLPESRERLSEFVLPRFDMDFWYEDDFQCSYHFADKNNISEEACEFLHSFKEKIFAAETDQIRPVKDARYCFLPPQTRAHHQYPPQDNVNYVWVDNETYPWCGLNITMFMQCLLSDLHTECRVASKKLELLWEAFGEFDQYQTSYAPTNFRIKCTYHPILVINAKLKEMETWLGQNHPELLEHFMRLKCFEGMVLDASEWISDYLNKPYDEPEQIEKNRFNHWIAEWLNAAILLGLKSKGADYFRETLVEGQTLDGKPVKDISEEELHAVAIKIRSSIFHALRLTTLDSIALLAAYSPQTASRLSESAFSWIDAECSHGWPHYHYMLGHPQAVQNADRENPEHISLLTIVHDDRLMKAFGGGTVLQFWIKLEDLKNKAFEKVIPSGE